MNRAFARITLTSELNYLPTKKYVFHHHTDIPSDIRAVLDGGNYPSDKINFLTSDIYPSKLQMRGEKCILAEWWVMPIDYKNGFKVILNEWMLDKGNMPFSGWYFNRMVNLFNMSHEPRF